MEENAVRVLFERYANQVLIVFPTRLSAVFFLNHVFKHLSVVTVYFVVSVCVVRMS